MFEQEWEVAKGIAEDNVGQGGGIMQNLALLGTSIIVLAIVLVVTFNITGSFNPEAGSYADNALGTLSERAVTAFNLGGLVPIAIAGAIILGVIFAAIFGVIGGGGRRAGGAPTMT